MQHTSQRVIGLSDVGMDIMPASPLTWFETDGRASTHALFDGLSPPIGGFAQAYSPSGPRLMRDLPFFRLLYTIEQPGRDI